MNSIKAALRFVWSGIRKAREWASGDDLADAQSHRGDDHEFRVNGGPMF